MTSLVSRGPVAGMVTPGWETVLTRVKTLTRVFEGRETHLLTDSNTLCLKTHTYYAGLTHMSRTPTRLTLSPLYRTNHV